MKVGILVAFAGRGSGGPEVFEREFCRAVSAMAPQNEYHLFCLDRGATSIIDLPEDRVVYHRLQPSVRAVAMLTSLPLAISKIGAPVFHAPVIPPPFCPTNTVMAMPCSSLLLHPQFYPPLIRLRLRFLLHRAAAVSRKIICPSEHVRDVVRDKLKIPLNKLPVIPPGVSSLFAPVRQEESRHRLEARYGIRDPYFLFSGRWERRKNLIRILEAFAIFKKNTKTKHRLVLTGSQSWGSEEIPQAIERLKISGVVTDLGKTPLDELPSLYAGSEALVYASLWEGFGMPIIEAMACGTPVITSNVAAMPETAGGAALLVDPNSAEDIAGAMYRVATDAQLRDSLRTLGLERGRQFSWERTARETLKIYQEVAG